MQSRGASGGRSYGSTDPRAPGGRVNPFGDVDDDMAPFGNANGSSGSLSDIRDSISGDIITINSSASGLERSLKALGTNKDTAQLREKIHESELSTNKIIARVTTSLKQLSALCAKSSKVERLQCEKLANDFKEAVQRYSTMQKRVADKVKSIPGVPAQSAMPDLIGWNDEPGDAYGRQQQQQQQMLLEEQADTELMLIQEREEQIRQLEGDILDVNDIFKELGTLVHGQGETIDSIEAHVESAYSDVEEGTQQLQKASRYQVNPFNPNYALERRTHTASARKKKCCLIILLLVVIAVIILIIVLSVKYHK